ncbi:MAG: hypothetical protein CMG64_05190 [Candidatus Marinimicrobia bacterium]|nr:hypothetical protein [Candidatus Neomarinimicrobiota bacterium]|tara:strand:- start:4823 stop:5524 length:702 start_codon:yes stop_codon:yes gene_type:complete
MKIGIISCGPGLKEVVKDYGHSSEWIPAIISHKDVEFSVVKVYNYEEVDFESADAWIITGSKYSVYEDIAWIHCLEKFVKELISRKKYILGICFGHQLLAKCLGGVVKKNPKGWELGSYNISLTNNGVKSKLFYDFLDSDIAYESHQDVVLKLPNDSLELAYTDKGNQSFSYLERIYGVQFHPEFSYDVTRRLMDIRLKNGVKIDNNELLQADNACNILNNFIDIVKEGVLNE